MFKFKMFMKYVMDVICLQQSPRQKSLCAVVFCNTGTRSACSKRSTNPWSSWTYWSALMQCHSGSPDTACVKGSQGLNEGLFAVSFFLIREWEEGVERERERA